MLVYMQAPAEPVAVYRSWHAVAAAFAGAAGTTLAHGVSHLQDRDKFLGIILAWFVVGLPAVALVGLPVARKLARRSRDTVLTGLLYGAVGGSIIGAALALAVTYLAFPGIIDARHLARVWREGPIALFAILSPALIGISIGIPYGACAGATLAWCGRISRRGR